MAAVARVGHRTTGNCSAHEGNPVVGGTVMSGSTTVYVNGYLVAIIGGTVLSDCGHTGTINSGSPTVFNGTAIARIGDTFTGTYVGSIIEGSGNVFADEG